MREGGAARAMERIAALRAISAEPDRYTRLYLTPEHRKAADLLLSWMEEAGLEARMDAAGNVIGRAEGARSGPALVLGSHFDTVRDAGAYDGQFGVVAAIEVAEALSRQGLPAPLEVHAYADEEGTRFHTMLLGSGLVTGMEDESALAYRDADGVTLGEALVAFGLDPARIGEARRRPGEFAAYLELHIEQGPVLESLGLPLAAVTAIAGQTRALAEVEGVAGHAGTVPMALRRDALAAGAEAVLAVEGIAREREGVVATVGELTVVGGASNVVPGRVRFSLDLRSGEDARRAEALAAIRARFEEIGGARSCPVSLDIRSDTPATLCDARVVEAAAEAVAAVQGRDVRLVSGAGHDAIALSRLCPVGMIFLRCAGGISHNPAEAITEADAGAGIAALAQAAERLLCAA